jgi:hypothetical protein
MWNKEVHLYFNFIKKKGGVAFKTWKIMNWVTIEVVQWIVRPMLLPSRTVSGLNFN